MRKLLFVWLMFAAAVAVAEPPKTASATPPKPVKVYSTDAYGNVQYHKPSLVVQPDGRIRPVDAYGNTQYQKPGYVVKGDRIYQTDSYGNTQYQKPGYVVKGDRIYQTDAYGNTQYQKPGIRGEGRQGLSDRPVREYPVPQARVRGERAAASGAAEEMSRFQAPAAAIADVGCPGRG